MGEDGTVEEARRDTFREGEKKKPLTKNDDQSRQRVRDDN
jgi:hypothetical protein